MKLALLLPGYLDSPDYLHLRTFEKRFGELGYTTERIDSCNLWKTGDVSKYSITNLLNQIKQRINDYKPKKLNEVILIGHSLGGFTSIIAGNLFDEITKIILLCPPSSIEGLAKKWEDKSSRISKRDLPDDVSKFREFDVPISFVEDARKYSAIDALHQLKKPLMIFISMNDTSVSPEETEKLVTNANNPHVVRMPNMGHDFRYSQTECNIVMKEIERFITI